MKTLIKNAEIVNENKRFKGHVLIQNQYIEDVFTRLPKNLQADEIIDAEGLILIPGMIDDQVHFREPGLTHKAEIETESRAAVAGGITSYMEMPNTSPPALTNDLLEEKYARAARVSAANYSFYLGAGIDNAAELKKMDTANICGVKIFMGSSTGDLAVRDEDVLQKVFSSAKTIIASHCEEDPVIEKKAEEYKKRFGEDIPIHHHPDIRSREACYISSEKAIHFANENNARLHILHISTAEETDLFTNKIPLKEKQITAEACVHHLWFSREDYDKKGTHIKWNPAVKERSDADAILAAINDDRIDIIATDHAPHTLEEKDNTYFKAPSGGPLVQHALQVLFELNRRGKITLEKIVEKTAHNPAVLFDIEKRGYIKKGYFADLVLINPNKPQTVTKENLLYKCGWSPFEGTTFSTSVERTFVNGLQVWNNGTLNIQQSGMRLTFKR